MESRDSCWAADGGAWKIDGRAQALVGPGLATPLCVCTYVCVYMCIASSLDTTNYQLSKNGAYSSK